MVICESAIQTVSFNTIGIVIITLLDARSWLRYQFVNRLHIIYIFTCFCHMLNVASVICMYELLVIILL